MEALIRAVARLLDLGGPGRHPASAIAGLWAGTQAQVAAAGWAQLPAAAHPGTPMTRDTLIDLASVTKVVSATTLAMRLYADGLLELDTPVCRYLPGFRGDAKDDITIEHLLTHTAGLRAWWPLYCETTESADAIERAQALSLVARPGTAWIYSDLGLMLTGCVIERITSLSLADAFREMVAHPLGLSTTYGPVPASRAAASADSDAYEYGMIATGQPYPVPYTTTQFTGWRDQPLRGVVNDGNTAHALGGVSGHAGLYGSVDDLLNLGAALLEGDLIPRPVLDRFAVGSSLNPEQALGFRLQPFDIGGQTHTLLYHGGFTGTFFAFTLNRELVVAGGAMRLYGTLGGLPAQGTAPQMDHLVPGPEIHQILLDAARQALADASSNPRPLGENR